MLSNLYLFLTWKGPWKFIYIPMKWISFSAFQNIVGLIDFARCF